MRLAALAAVAATLVGAEPGWSQATDPYSSQVKEHDAQALSEIKLKALQAISYLYYAYGCKVFANEGQFASLQQSYFMAGHSAMIEYRLLDLRWPEKVAQAAHSGLEKSSSAGCEYWQQNIEEVSNLRRQASQAVRESLPYRLR